MTASVTIHLHCGENDAKNVNGDFTFFDLQVYAVMSWCPEL